MQLKYITSFPFQHGAIKEKKNFINRTVYFIGVYCMNSLKDAVFDF